MSKTPRTEKAKFSGIHAHPYEEYVDADFARELERENTHLLVLATNAEFDRSKLERELAAAKAENARLKIYNRQAEDAAEQLKSENTQLRDAGKALRDALAFECHKLGDCPREIDAWDALAKAGYSL
jgi:hypothetical protein